MTLKYINNQLSINGHDVKTIAEQYGTPYLFMMKI